MFPTNEFESEPQKVTLVLVVPNCVRRDDANRL